MASYKKKIIIINGHHTTHRKVYQSIDIEESKAVEDANLASRLATTFQLYLQIQEHIMSYPKGHPFGHLTCSR